MTPVCVGCDHSGEPLAASSAVNSPEPVPWKTRPPAVASAQQACPGDGTPNQFTPRNPPDTRPLENEFEKYPKCPYCGMDRKEHNRSRMLVQYSDDLVDGTCSIHCLALSLGLNVDREPKEIWGPDFANSADPRPLLPVDKLTYLIGADLKHAMT